MLTHAYATLLRSEVFANSNCGCLDKEHACIYPNVRFVGLPDRYGCIDNGTRPRSWPSVSTVVLEESKTPRMASSFTRADWLASQRLCWWLRGLAPIPKPVKIESMQFADRLQDPSMSPYHSLCKAAMRFHNSDGRMEHRSALEHAFLIHVEEYFKARYAWPTQR